MSPDGRWLAYGASQSGRVEVFVEGYPTAGIRRAREDFPEAGVGKCPPAVPRLGDTMRRRGARGWHETCLSDGQRGRFVHHEAEEAP